MATPDIVVIAAYGVVKGRLMMVRKGEGRHQIGLPDPTPAMTKDRMALMVGKDRVVDAAIVGVKCW